MTARRTSRTDSPKPSSIWKVRLGAPHRRMTMLLTGVVAIALVLGLRCVWVQGLDPAGNANRALMPQSQVIPAIRGTISDRNGLVLAHSVPAVNITADPTMVSTNGQVWDSMSLAQRLKAKAGPGIIAGVLNVYLGGDYQTYYDRLSATKTDSGNQIKYTVLKRAVPTYNNLEVTDHLSKLGYVGLFREQAPIREFTNGPIGSNIIGFMTYSDELAAQNKYPMTGGEGLEYALNEGLTGRDGVEIFESSPHGKIPTGTSVIEQPQDGISYQLTIDSGLQYMQDQRLAAAVLSSGARSGSAVTINARNGEILAASNYPTFDSNRPSGDSKHLGNRLARSVYEPGSVHKVVTMAIAIDTGKVTMDTKVEVPAKIVSGDSLIGDSWSHGTVHLTPAGVLARSSNVGMVELARQVDTKVLVEYLESFGLGASTGSGMPGEATGYLPDAQMSGQTRDNIAFGQGLSVTVLQEAAAIAAIVNGGVYNSPKLLLSATTADGKPVPLPAQSSRRVVSAETSATMRTMMEAVVQLNTGTFDIPGYRTAGKSGTAQAIDPACGCYRGYVSSYIGAAPAEDPYLLTYVVLDHPANDASGSAVAAPVVRDVMAVALERYGVPVSTTPRPEVPLTW